MLRRSCAASTAAAITTVSLGNTGSTASPAHTAASSRYVQGEPETALAIELNTSLGYPAQTGPNSIMEPMARPDPRLTVAPPPIGSTDRHLEEGSFDAFLNSLRRSPYGYAS